MNDEQKLRLRVASEQMAALITEPVVVVGGKYLFEDLCNSEEPRGMTVEEIFAFAASKLADALIAEIERTAKAAPVEPAPKKHPGWVFVDRDGDVWGWRPPTPGVPNYCRGTTDTVRPFLTREEAAAQAARCSFGILEVRPWRPTDSVPPMPEGE